MNHVYRTRIAQLIHDWQYTGDRKELMGECDTQCPFGCKSQEGKVHYISCQKKPIAEARQIHRRIFSKVLHSMNTYPGISTVLQ